MNIQYELNKTDVLFRNEVRQFIQSHLPQDIQVKVQNKHRLEKSDYLRWHKILFKKGWVAPAWPAKYGGTDWTPLQRHLFEEELALASSPRIMPFGISMVAPVLMHFGDEKQKQFYLPRILSGEDWWCQGYSEPGAGSDLASLTTKAVPDGSDYVVTGAKTWTTLAQYADMMFCLVRTSSEGKRQEGISFLLINMRSKGIRVSPIKTIDGGQEINDVYFDQVRVPKTNLVGMENKGWKYAKFLLGYERTGIAAVGRSKQEMIRLKEIASKEMSSSGPLNEDLVFQDKISDLEIDILALESLVLRILEDESLGKKPGPEASILKIRGTEIQQQISELALEAVGYYANPFLTQSETPGWNGEPIGPEYSRTAAQHYFSWRKASIYGGTNEIQKNIIAKMVLQL